MADGSLVPVDEHHPPLAASVRLEGARAQRPVRAGAAPTCTSRPRWNFYKADYELLYSMLASTDWTDMYEMSDVEDILNFFYDKMNNILDASVPRKAFTVNKRYIYPKWYTRDIIKNLKIKASLHKMYKKTKVNSDYDEYSKYRAITKKIIEIAHVQHQNNIQCQFAKDPKSFWQYIRSQKSATSGQDIIKDGQYLSDEECAEQFATYFESVYSSAPPRLDSKAAAAEAVNAGSAYVQIKNLSVKDVRNALERLKPKRSAGPDGIPAFLFKDCGRILVEPLLHIFNACLHSAKFPARWKITRVIPVPKGRAGADISGYRPVAVLSTPAKVFESAIHHGIQEQVSRQLSDAQHGFRPGRSTATNLLNFMGYVVPAVDAGVQVDVAYFDFKKAFDTVDNDILLRKLAEVGCTPHLLQFFASYMQNRQQYVDYNGCESELYHTWSGVSQGSNLGPLQFIIMINNLPEVVRHGSCLLYADDLKLLLEIKSESDCERLQEDIDRVVKWSHENKLYFNVSKCSVMSYTRARAPLLYEYVVDAAPMQRVREVRDLGVLMAPDLSFREHVTKICKKAYRNLGFVLRQTRSFTNITSVRVLYDALVRSHLEHSAVIWAPHEAKYSVMLERVQNKFTRHLYKKLYGVYPFYPLMYPTLFVLGMVGYNQLHVRRDFTLIAYLVRVLRGVKSNPGVLQRLSLCVPDRYVWRRHRPPLLLVPTARTNLLAKAPITRAIRNINDLQTQIDVFTCSWSEFARVLLYTLCYKQNKT